MRKYLVMVMVIVFVLTTIGIVRAAEGVTSEQNILGTNTVISKYTFPFGTKFYVAKVKEKNVLQYQLPGEQTWKEIPLTRDYYTIEHHTVTYTISKRMAAKGTTRIRVVTISDRDSKKICIITPVYIIQKHSLRQLFWFWGV